MFLGFRFSVSVVFCVGFVLWKCLRFIFLRFGVLSGGRSFVAEDFYFFVFWVLCVFSGSSGVGGDEAFADARDAGAGFSESGSRGGGGSSRSPSATLAGAVGCNAAGKR